MAGVLDFLPLLLAQQAGRQRLARRPEPDELTEAAANVIQYDRVMCTKLVTAYAAGLEIVYRARTARTDTSAVDLACGPGHYTLCLSKYLGYKQVTGVDLSSPMVETADINARKVLEDNSVRFQVGDVTRLEQFGGGHFDLTSFTDAAHHMPDLETVSHVLREMERITRPEGLVMLMDLARLRTESLTERYVQVLAHDYLDRDLPRFFEDFRNSMYAAWTTRELWNAVPHQTNRLWCQLVPRGLPTVQFVLGLPVGRRKLFVRSGWKPSEHPLVSEWFPRWEKEVGRRWAVETRREWRMLRGALACGMRRCSIKSRTL